MTQSRNIRAEAPERHEAARDVGTTEAITPGVLSAVDSKMYYVRVELVGAGGETRRATVEVPGDLLRGLSIARGNPAKARDWIRVYVKAACQEHPQDLSLGPARWKSALRRSLSEHVEHGVRAYLQVLADGDKSVTNGEPGAQ